MPAQKSVLTTEEKRNLELVKGWAASWDKESGEMVDIFYADQPEVYLPLQNLYMAKSGRSKVDWRAVEVANRKLYTNRKMKLVACIARGDTVAMEIQTSETNLIGKTRDGYIGVFLRFNRDGKIISDHTYMLNADKTPNPEKAKDPNIKKLMQVLKDAHQKIMRENGY
jgi:predicted SnoaL-like aldol condensation-catalyzing enzyme